ncbi:transcriptional regulatory protein AlgP-like [Jatropha curcas]|uniref:transcriptional regulatory protein AlgP-like n=1 Tax=Jatropha curcas TaxID=180498 RepID=UPI0018930940|nr:transcriptional regulatory protein AlgP-like [Jatropha curcas]
MDRGSAVAPAAGRQVLGGSGRPAEPPDAALPAALSPPAGRPRPSAASPAARPVFRRLGRGSAALPRLSRRDGPRARCWLRVAEPPGQAKDRSLLRPFGNSLFREASGLTTRTPRRRPVTDPTSSTPVGVLASRPGLKPIPAAF